ERQWPDPHQSDGQSLRQEPLRCLVGKRRGDGVGPVGGSGAAPGFLDHDQAGDTTATAGEEAAAATSAAAELAAATWAAARPRPLRPGPCWFTCPGASSQCYRVHAPPRGGRCGRRTAAASRGRTLTGASRTSGPGASTT